MSYPTMFRTPDVRTFAEAIDDERAAQIAKFGDQRHPDGTGPDATLLGWSVTDYRDVLRSAVDDANARGEASWLGIFLEEAFEAVSETDPAKLRAELVQVAAVCAAWIYDIDQRPAS